MLIFYNGSDEVWHERFLCYRLHGAVWYIRTPDGDEYEEDLLAEDTLLRRVRADGGIPSPGSLGAQAYRFSDDLTREQVEAAIRRGKRYVDRFFKNGGDAELAVVGRQVQARDYRDWSGVIRALPRDISGAAPETEALVTREAEGTRTACCLQSA